mgnify:FL=1
MHVRTLAAAVALALPLTACSQSDDRDSVVVAASAAPAGLDFTTTGGAAAPQALVGNVYETLVRIDASGTPVLIEDLPDEPLFRRIAAASTR